MSEVAGKHVTFQPDGSATVYYMGLLMAVNDTVKQNTVFSFPGGERPASEDQWEEYIQGKAGSMSKNLTLAFDQYAIGRVNGSVTVWDTTFCRFDTNASGATMGGMNGQTITFQDATAHTIASAPSQTSAGKPSLVGTNMWYVEISAAHTIPTGAAYIREYIGYFREGVWWEERMEQLIDVGNIGTLVMYSEGIYDTETEVITADYSKTYKSRLLRASVIEPYGSLPALGYKLEVRLRKYT